MSRVLRRLLLQPLVTPRPIPRFSDRRARLLLQSLEQRITPANFTVLNSNDAGAGSLRQAILDANAAIDADEIVFNTNPAAGTDFSTPRAITLTGGELKIANPLVLTGPGAALLTVSGNNASRVFNIDGPGVLNVTLAGLTVTGGRVTTSQGGGGIFVADEILAVRDAVVTANAAPNGNGGGIAGGSGAIVGVFNTTVSNNSAGSGGGLSFSEAYNFGGLFLENSTVTGNTAVGNGNGGGISASASSEGQAVLWVRLSTIAGNSAGDGGGGIDVDALLGDASVLVENSTISGNSASGNLGGGGGGVHFFGRVGSGGATVVCSTISGNTAFDGGGVQVSYLTGNVLFQNCTITGNTAAAAFRRGGLLKLGPGGTVTLTSTILAGNTAAQAGSANDDLGATVSNSNSVTATFSAIGVAPVAGVLSAQSASNLPFGAALNLGPLANNGGPTQTHALGAGSAAINAGANSASRFFDQRAFGFPRTAGSTDIGAYEFVAPGTPSATADLANVLTSGSTAYTFEVTYTDDTAINVGTLDGNDLRVTGPNGFNVLAAFQGVTPAGNGTPRTATYRFTPPGGAWDGPDIGEYTVAVEPNQVADTAGNVALAVGLGSFQVIVPATFTVTNANDAGPGSLRQAILDANANRPVADTIAFDTAFFNTPRTITLTGGELLVTEALTVTGPGASLLTVSGNNASRVFNIGGLAVFDATLSGLTVTGGLADSGSAISSSAGGTLTVLDAIVTANATTQSFLFDKMSKVGAAIVARERKNDFERRFPLHPGTKWDDLINIIDPLPSERSIILSNVANRLVVRNTAVTNNSGGGIGVEGATLFLANSTVAGNIASAGGGILFTDGGSLLMEGSTVSGNVARDGFGGGGLYFRGAVGADGVTIRNSTISGNTAQHGGGIRLYDLVGNVLIQNSTITGNTATATVNQPGRAGGGIALGNNGVPGGTVTLVGSIVAGNVAASADPADDDLNSQTGNTITATFSAIGRKPGAGVLSDQSGNNVPYGAALNLRPLGNNGGPILTHSLGAGSAAIDTGVNPANLTTDQRGTGFPRINGSLIDIGAFESPPPGTPSPDGTFPDVSTNGGTIYTFQVTYTDDNGINVATLDNSDIRVSGPNGFNVLATFVSVTPAGNGTPRTATYSFTPPGGSWDPADRGTYAIAVEPNQVADTSGTFVPFGLVNVFQMLGAATFIVTNVADSGAGSLRQAILDANARTGTADFVVFDAGFFATPQTITLTGGQLSITESLTITGPGANLLTVSGNNASRVFQVQTAVALDVTVSGLTITGGRVTGADGGGVLFSAGTGSHLTILTAVVTGNAITGSSGGGGGIAFTPSTATNFLTIRNSTIASNTAPFGGGLYFNSSGPLTLVNSTVSGNTASSFYGGGIVMYGFGVKTIQNSTITGNTAPRSGGLASNGPVTLTSTILAGNTGAVAGTADDDLSGNAVTATFSAIGADPGAGVLTAASSNNRPFGSALNLGPLANNGGPTPTHALGAGSVAINAGANPAGLADDQRGTGFTRVNGGVADIGAFESLVTTPGVTGTFPNVTVSNGLPYAFQVTYSDEGLIDTSTIGTGDMRVTGPNGFNVLAGFVSVDSTADGPVRIATYSFTPPGGLWDSADIGAYVIAVEPNQVADTTGAFVPAGAVGGFRVILPATFPVTNANDSGPGSLRQALLDADANSPAADAIAFDPGFFATPRTITLTSGQLRISESLTITGPGANLLTVSGNNASRVFLIVGFGVLTVTLSGLTITGGSSSGGGGISGGGNITLQDAVVTANAANGGGGGGLDVSGSVTVRNTTVSNNTASGSGGGISFFSSGTSSLVVENSTLASNTAGGGGGVYFNTSGASTGSLTIRNSTLSGNTATQASGGAGGGVLLVNGFGIGAALIQNTTITGNTAMGTNPSFGPGGGGLALTGTGGTVTLVSTIVSGNTAALAGAANDDLASAVSGAVTATFSALGADPGAGVLNAASGNNLEFGADLKLQGLANNGGPTPTIALGSGSPAINAGANPASLTTDQRGSGFARVGGPAADIGAFEVQVATAPTVTAVGANNGTTQRSMVTSLQVTFSSLVTIAPGAFTLTYIGAPAGPTGGVVGSTVGNFTVSTATVGGVTVATLSTFSGTDTLNGSLIDGRYSLTVDHTKVTATVGGLAMSSDFTFADSGATTGNQLYRLYGDATGDRVVNGADLTPLIQQFGSPSLAFDFNADGVFNGADLTEFVKRFGVGV